MTLLSSLQKLTKFLTILQELRTVRSAELWKYKNVRQYMVMVVSGDGGQCGDVITIIKRCFTLNI